MTLLRAFKHAHCPAVPRYPEELMAWISLFESGAVRATIPRLMVVDADAINSELIRALRGKSPWSGIPTVVYGSENCAAQVESLYGIGFSAVCLHPQPLEAEEWAHSLATYWSRVAALPGAELHGASNLVREV